ncbi:Hypothetical predicted protein [Octopus vulgaris]|uniref:Uncharacterized protein n=1 Tax=Octopus vulgaris TaxID=6645 RepID=A0AA36BCU0_OCTVU|nr:Hypothetical predicted protein [Octopus vulgaris]
MVMRYVLCKRMRLLSIDLDSIENDILLLQNLFDCKLDVMSVEVRLVLIDLKADDSLKKKQREGKLVE